MKKIDLGQTVQIIANVGVIAGIIFLAIELRQNNEQLKLQSYQAWVAANLELNNTAAVDDLSEILIVGNANSADLDRGNAIEYALWNYSFFQLIQATDYLYQTGSLDPALWDSEINRAAVHLGLPGVRQWWDAGGRTQLTPEFVRLVESTESTAIRWGFEEGKGFVEDPLQ